MMHGRGSGAVDDDRQSPTAGGPTGRGADRVAVIGGGVSGIVSARVLSAAGFSVTLFEKAGDLGGVWSASRTYPGIATQDDRRSYTFSDATMSPESAQHPSGEQVRDYLEGYLRSAPAGVELRLGTEVVRAVRGPGLEWLIDSTGPDGSRVEGFDWLVAASGVFSIPHVPDWPGRAEFEAGGGHVVVPGALGDGSVLIGRRTVVVGWGKTACDVAVAAAARGFSTDVVARTITWKYPKRLGLLGLTFRHIVLTRAGERVVGADYRGQHGRILLRRVPERLPRRLVGLVLARAADREGRFGAVGLRPSVDFRASTSLVTDGFFEAVAAGGIAVHREREIERLGADEEGPWIDLEGGARLRADLVVAATGYEQGVPYLDDEISARGAAVDGALLLHRRVLAADVPRLAFVGWAHNYRSPLTSEISATWLAAVMRGAIEVGTSARERRRASRFLIGRPRRAGARAPVLPAVSMRDLDALLGELGAPLPWRTRLRQVLVPLDPADYGPALRTAREGLAGQHPSCADPPSGLAGVRRARRPVGRTIRWRRARAHLD